MSEIDGLRLICIMLLVLLHIQDGMCYSIYLTHFPLLILLAPFGRALSRSALLPPMLAETLVLTPVILLVGLAFFVLVERPCMDPDWPRRPVDSLRFRRREDASAAIVAPEID
jgi:peptidoglycan/LPS O-acetylase OafA/YrhL